MCKYMDLTKVSAGHDQDVILVVDRKQLVGLIARHLAAE